jgi:hypothetical protein
MTQMIAMAVLSAGGLMKAADPPVKLASFD